MYGKRFIDCKYTILALQILTLEGPGQELDMSCLEALGNR